jgi:hypothetical protein
MVGVRDAVEEAARPFVSRPGSQRSAQAVDDRWWRMSDARVDVVKMSAGIVGNYIDKPAAGVDAACQAALTQYIPTRQTLNVLAGALIAITLAKFPGAMESVEDGAPVPDYTRVPSERRPDLEVHAGVLFQVPEAHAGVRYRHGVVVDVHRSEDGDGRAPRRVTLAFSPANVPGSRWNGVEDMDLSEVADAGVALAPSWVCIEMNSGDEVIYQEMPPSD